MEEEHGGGAWRRSSLVDTADGAEWRKWVDGDGRGVWKKRRAEESSRTLMRITYQPLPLSSAMSSHLLDIAAVLTLII